MLRGPDAEHYLRLKRAIESNPSDSLAVYDDGSKRTVYLYSWGGKERFVVESDDCTFHEAQHLPGKQWVKWELKPEEAVLRAEEEKRRAEEAAKPRNFRELQQLAQQQARNDLTERQAANRQQNIDQSGLNQRLRTLAEANRKYANDVAARLRPDRRS